MKSLENLIGTKVTIETREGAFQTGKVSKVNYHEMTVLGQKVQIPTTIEFHNDPSEFAKVDLIVNIAKA